MLDLLSFRCRVNGELMITDQQDGGYMPTTFTDRGNDIYGRSAASKSTLFVDGLGCAANVQCDKTEIVKGDKLLGVRIDASHVYMPTWNNLFVGRLVLMVDSAYWLVIDHVRGANTADAHWMESRFHTLAECEATKTGVALTSNGQPLQMTFAALNSGALQQSTGMPSQPSVERTTIFRWMTERPNWDNLHVTALNPGDRKLALAIRRDKDTRYTIEVTGEKGYRRTIGLTSTLKLSKSS